jgi:hypothetical protein
MTESPVPEIASYPTPDHLTISDQATTSDPVATPDPAKIFLVDTITVEGLFGLFSIFFLSTVSLFISIILLTPTYTPIQFHDLILTSLIAIFFIGYAIIVTSIILYYIIRFSKFFALLYNRHKIGFKSVTLLSVIIISSGLASFLTMSSEITTRAIGISIAAIIVVILIMMQNLIIEIGQPLTQKISGWIKDFKPSQKK